MTVIGLPAALPSGVGGRVISPTALLHDHCQGRRCGFAPDNQPIARLGNQPRCAIAWASPESVRIVRIPTGKVYPHMPIPTITAGTGVEDTQEADWGWIAYHYGHWYRDPDFGWFWIPGDEWAPAWVDVAFSFSE